MNKVIIFLIAACWLLSFGTAQREGVINDLKSLIKEKQLVQTSNLEEVCKEDFLHMIRLRPEYGIAHEGFIGGGFFPLSHANSLDKDIESILIRNGVQLDDFEGRDIYVYSEGKKRGEGNSFRLWEVVKDSEGFFLHSPYLDPLCLTYSTYTTRVKSNKRLPVCKSGFSGGLGKSPCVAKEIYEQYLDE